MKTSHLIITTFAFLASYFSMTQAAFAVADSFAQDCQTVEKTPGIKKIEWIKTQMEQMGFSTNLKENEFLCTSLGDRNYILNLWADESDCEAVGAMLSSMKKIKDKKSPIQGMSFVISKNLDEYKKTLGQKVILKDTKITAEDLKKNPKLIDEAVKLDQNPAKIFVCTEYVKSFGKINTDIRRVVDEKEIKDLKDKIKKYEVASKNWALEQSYKFNEKIIKLTDKSVDRLNEKVTDLEKHIQLYDQVRRGLWTKVSQTSEKIKFPSPKLKDELSKGRMNTETIMKTIKSDVDNLEKDIKTSFTETKKLIEEQLKDPKTAEVPAAK
jgi:hypothetical protein